MVIISLYWDTGCISLSLLHQYVLCQQETHTPSRGVCSIGWWVVQEEVEDVYVYYMYTHIMYIILCIHAQNVHTLSACDCVQLVNTHILYVQCKHALLIISYQVKPCYFLNCVHLASLFIQWMMFFSTWCFYDNREDIHTHTYTQHTLAEHFLIM